MSAKAGTTQTSNTMSTYKYQIETTNAANALPPKSLDFQSHLIGLSQNEPLIIAMDSMIRYAKAHNQNYGSALSEDYILGEEWLSVVKGIRGLLNGNGAVANEMGRSRDSKSNGAVESMFWAALEVARYSEETANL